MNPRLAAVCTCGRPDAVEHLSGCNREYPFDPDIPLVFVTGRHDVVLDYLHGQAVIAEALKLKVSFVRSAGRLKLTFPGDGYTIRYMHIRRSDSMRGYSGPARWAWFEPSGLSERERELVAYHLKIVNLAGRR